MIRGRMAVVGFTGLAILVVGGVAVLLVAVFAPRPNRGPGGTPEPPPSSSADRIALQAGFRMYIEENIAATPGGGRPFCTWDLLGDRDVEGDVDAYIWAHCEEYVPGEGYALRGETLVVPAVLHLRAEGEAWVISGHDVPRPDDSYVADVESLFPSSLHGSVLGPGAVGAFPSIPRIRALEDLRVPLRYAPDVEVQGSGSPQRQVRDGEVAGARWTLAHEERTTADGGTAGCLRFSSEPTAPSPEDAPTTSHEMCAGPLPREVQVRKVVEAIVLDAGYGWTVGQATHEADTVEVVFTDQTRETHPVTDGIWVAVYDAVRYPLEVTARRGGRILATCGAAGERSC